MTVQQLKEWTEGLAKTMGLTVRQVGEIGEAIRLFSEKEKEDTDNDGNRKGQEGHSSS